MPRKRRKYEKYLTLGYDPQGRRIRKYISADSSAEFERKIYEAKKAAEAALLSSGISFGDYAARWLEVYKRPKELRTFEMYERAVNKCRCLFRIPLRDITTTDLQAIINENREHVRTCQQIKLTLRQIYDQAIADAIIPANNLAVRISLPKQQKREKRAFTAAEWSALSELELPPLYNLYVEVLKGTGMRPAEALALQWGDVKDLTIRVERAVTFDGNRAVLKCTKTGAVREIPIAKKLAEMLAGCEKRHIFIFSEDGRPFTKAKYKYMKKTVFDALGAEGLDFYTFRHTYATRLYYNAVKPGIISTKKAAQIMGHSEQIFIDRYTHIDDEKEALDRLRKIL